jgi:hypothetical protein
MNAALYPTAVATPCVQGASGALSDAEIERLAALSVACADLIREASAVVSAANLLLRQGYDARALDRLLTHRHSLQHQIGSLIGVVDGMAARGDIDLDATMVSAEEQRGRLRNCPQFQTR